jgi:hypothetical protein
MNPSPTLLNEGGQVTAAAYEPPDVLELGRAEDLILGGSGAGLECSCFTKCPCG